MKAHQRRLQHDGSTPNGTPPNFSRNRSRVGKIVNFQHLNRHISETVQDTVQVAMDHKHEHVHALSIGTKIDDLR